MIESIETFADLVGRTDIDIMPGDVMFSRENFAILIIGRGPDQNGTIPGELVEAGVGLDINGKINFTQGQFVTSHPSMKMHTDSLASTIVSSTHFEVFENTSTQSEDLTRLIFVIYDVNSPLFQDPNNTNVGSVILSFIRSPEQGPAPMNLEHPVKFQFQANQVLKFTGNTAVHTLDKGL